LLSYQPSQLFIANRTASKAQQLADIFTEFGNIQGGGFDELTGRFDVIINATSASLQGKVPPLPNDILNEQASCYDMMYSDTDTAFIIWAKQHGAGKSIDGLGMLVEQAAEAFRLWRGVKPDTKTVIEPLLSYQPSQLFIANRTASKAKQLADLFAEFGNVQGGGLDEVVGSFDLIINATSASLQGKVPPLPNDILNEQASCYDMMYGETDTTFIMWAKQHGATKAIDGLGMLAEQAAEAFRLWRDVKPETKTVIELIRHQKK
ncbi:MAG: hypothetical protein DRQ39_00600, partial [Gammaproteobacteria bacterium]